MSNDLFNTVCNSVKDVLNLDSTCTVTLDSKLRDELGLDSMSTLAFLISLENNIKGFVIDPENLDTKHLETIGSVIEYVNTEIKKVS